MFLFFKDKTKFERFLINKQLNYLCFSYFPGYHLKVEKQKNHFFDHRGKKKWLARLKISNKILTLQIQNTMCT